jgi:hypothetical protein
MTDYLVADIKQVAKLLGDPRRTDFYAPGAIDIVAGRYFAETAAAPKAAEHVGWLIDFRDEDGYYRQSSEKHKTMQTVAAAGASIVAVGCNGLLWSVPASFVQLGGRSATGIRRLIADWTRQPLDPAVSVLWHGIVLPGEEHKVRLWLVGNHHAKDEAHCKLITLDGVQTCRRKPKWLGLVPAAGGLVQDLGEACVVTAEYADGHKAAFDLRQLGSPEAWHKVGSVMRRARLNRLAPGNTTGKRVSKSYKA